MSIPFNTNFYVARKVLSAVNQIMPKKLQKECVVEAYMNGREVGYSVWSSKHLPAVRVSFSENRNSDDIVVYAGISGDFSMQGNVPSDEIYKNAHYFAYDKVEDAAKFIATFLSVDGK